jgi:hypothetical protein
LWLVIGILTKKAEGRGQTAFMNNKKALPSPTFVNAHPFPGIKIKKIFSKKASSLEGKRRPYFNPFFFRERVHKSHLPPAFCLYEL